ncbi:hypothetical protein ACF1BH_14480, partial [Streptomyces sp. NPDC014733]
MTRYPYVGETSVALGTLVVGSRKPLGEIGTNVSHPTRRYARKAAAAMVITIAAFGLTACQDGGTGTSSTSSSSSSSSAEAPADGAGSATAEAGRGSAGGAAARTPGKPGVKCTDQINYAGDSRSNAE